MNYEEFFVQQLASLEREGRYRVFADLERQVGAVPPRHPPPRRTAKPR